MTKYNPDKAELDSTPYLSRNFVFAPHPDAVNFLGTVFQAVIFGKALIRTLTMRRDGLVTLRTEYSIVSEYMCDVGVPNKNEKNRKGKSDSSKLEYQISTGEKVSTSKKEEVVLVSRNNTAAGDGQGGPEKISDQLKKLITVT